MNRKLRRNTREGALSGVCAGLAEYFQIDKSWVRLAFVVSVIFSSMLGLGLLGPILYIVLWIVLPVRPAMEPDFFAGSGSPYGGGTPFDVDYRVREEQPPAYEQESFYERPEPSGPQKPFTENPPDDVPKSRHRDRYMAGLILLMIGSFFLMHQLGLVIWRDLFMYWPVLLILSGAVMLFNAFSGPKRIG